MEDNVKKSLDDIFNRHREAEQARQVQKEAVVSAEAKFKAEFAEAIDSIIQPVMNEIGEYIKSQGYDFRIDRKAERVENQRTGQTTPASVSLVIITKDEPRHSQKNPSFTIFAEVHSKKVRFLESTPSMSGPAGEYPLTALTREIVQAGIVKLLNRVFR
ncbi:hypothetical protein [Rhizobium sp. Nf11,1]|uniref:hypothetical protein n=1 Tax=Rhizobium sp. Nf11,1 TaxID=3404923 RepID=UPI003D348297